ncbi:uncharacterized protein PGTG_21800 [Puccinia graminis f. sp. tritici CRL 75-36-700-3]|uniref:Uncharacterized protein n=1 Tax=Puccinia graminis f. sp. tritici (strain CRL 75-36-700-3 / race SCCL) TaxID=418459 RepID=H6QSI7_PUCGT|nr:uncharacterized protein PGTG_21800 [Puccinia graminis f. sp. tritici CRL 75-36-700-3]EHS63724.1 hypothetical protein PGTG_21800 [Puccinia graminis f. sp. tritici CRL 75-36-700-3]
MSKISPSKTIVCFRLRLDRAELPTRPTADCGWMLLRKSGAELHRSLRPDDVIQSPRVIPNIRMNDSATSGSSSKAHSRLVRKHQRPGSAIISVDIWDAQREAYGKEITAAQVHIHKAPGSTFKITWLTCSLWPEYRLGGLHM